MKPASFEYFAPDTLAGVIEVLGAHGEDGRIIAGGQSLVPLMNMRMLRPSVLVSINHCPALAYLRETATGVAVGAGMRQADVASSPLVQEFCPLLWRALPFVGCTATRNRGTVCGSLAHADPAAELPAVAVALEAIFVLNGVAGRREVAAGDFFLGELTTAVAPGEMLEEVHFPAQPPDSVSAFVKVGTRAHGFAVAAMAATLEIDAAGRCTSARLAGVGFGPHAVRLREAERLLAGSALSDDALRAAAAAAVAAVDPHGDIHADAAYRKHLAGVLVGRCVDEARAQHSARMTKQ